MDEAAARTYITGLAEHFGRPPADVFRDLESFSELLRKWTATQNLVSRETVRQIWSRHIADSLQLLPLVRRALAGATDQKGILDLGSGGGLPALPLAIALKGLAVPITLVEPIGKKVAFLRTVIRTLDLNATVFAGRSDQLDSRETRSNVITSRALASLSELFGMIYPVFRPDSVAILHKGKDHAVELEESRLAWRCDVVETPSVTDDRAVLLQIRTLRLKSDL